MFSQFRFAGLACMAVVLTAPISVQSQSMNPYPSPGDVPQVIELTEGDVTRYIAAMKELRKLGLRLDGADAATDEKQILQALAASGDMQATLARHGFDFLSLQTVAQSLVMAVAALEFDTADAKKVREDQEKMMAELERQMSPEQFAQLKVGLETTLEAMAQLDDQPAGNIQLARKFRQELDRLHQ